MNPTESNKNAAIRAVPVYQEYFSGAYGGSRSDLGRDGLEGVELREEIGERGASFETPSTV